MDERKFKIGDKVRVKPYDKVWEIISCRSVLTSGCIWSFYYTLRYEDDKVTYTLDNAPEEHLELVEYNDCSCDCCDCCYHDECEDYDDDDWDDDEDFENNKEAENLDNDKKFNLGNLAVSQTYPQIREYFYDPWTATTVVKWTDNTITKVKAAEGDTPDQHTGLANAVAKKYFGNGNLFAREAKWWIVDEPKARKEEEEFCKNYDAEQAHKAEKRKANRERRIINAKALARKREYEARKLAEKKYGVPAEWGGESD